MDTLAVLSTPILIAISVVLAGVVSVIFSKNKYKPPQPGDNGPYIVVSLVGLILIIIGVVIATKTINLYVNGIEANGRIEKVYGSHSSHKTRHRTQLGGTATGSSNKKYALVSYETKTGTTETEVQIKPYNSARVGEEVTVIYLPTLPPRAAIRGYADLEYILFAPLLLIVVGGLFLSTGIGGWAQKNDNSVIKKKLISLSSTILITLILSVPILISTWALYKYVPSSYYRFYKFMAREDTLYEPLLGPGVVVTKPTYTEYADACEPRISIRSLSHTVASSGDVIELHGKWGEFTSNKVPRITAGRRLKVLEWKPEIIRVEIPKWLKSGKHKIFVNCYNVSSHKSYWPSGSLEILID